MINWLGLKGLRNKSLLLLTVYYLLFIFLFKRSKFPEGIFSFVSHTMQNKFNFII